MLDALEIGYAIKDKRAELGMAQAQVAEAAGVSKRCLWSLELGQNAGVQLNKLTAVLGALGLELKIVDVGQPVAAPVDNASDSPTLLPAMENHPGTIDVLAILTESAQLDSAR